MLTHRAARTVDIPPTTHNTGNVKMASPSISSCAFTLPNMWNFKINGVNCLVNMCSDKLTKQKFTKNHQLSTKHGIRYHLLLRDGNDE